MAAPYVMASAAWGTPPGECNPPTPTLLTATAGDQQVMTTWQEIPGDPVLVDGYKLYYDQAGKAQLVADVMGQPSNNYTDTGLTNGQEYCYKVTSYYYTDPVTGTVCESGFSNILCATPDTPGQTMNAGVSMLETGMYVKSGKGKNQTITWTVTSTFAAGDEVTVRTYVEDEQNNPLANATVDIAISGPETVSLTTGPSDADGIAEATWATSKPNKKGVGGTTPGTYTATTTNVTATGYTWDGVMTNANFTIQ
jgi:hypothetical protein